MPVIVDPKQLNPYQPRFIGRTIEFFTHPYSFSAGYEYHQICFQASDWIYSAEQCLGQCTDCKEHFHEHQEKLSWIRNMVAKSLEYADIWYQRDKIVELHVTRSLLRALLKLIDYKLLKCQESELVDTLRASLADYHRFSTENLDESDRIAMGYFPESFDTEPHLVDSTAELLRRLDDAFMRMNFTDYQMVYHDVDYLTRVAQSLLAKATHYIVEESDYYDNENYVAHEEKVKPKQLYDVFLRELSLIHRSVTDISQALEPLARFAVSAEFGDISRNHRLLLLLLIHGDCLAGFISALFKLAIDEPSDYKIISWLDTIIGMIKEAVADDDDFKFMFTACKSLQEIKEFRVTSSLCFWLECLIRNTGDQADDSNNVIYPPERHFKRFFRILAPTGWTESDVFKEFEAQRTPGVCECRFEAQSDDHTMGISGPDEYGSSLSLPSLPKDVLHKIFSILATNDYFSLHALSWTCRAIRYECKEFMDKYPWRLYREKKCTRNRLICRACKDSVRRDYIDNLAQKINFVGDNPSHIKWHF